MQNLPLVVISGSIAIDRIMNFGGHFTDLIKFEKIHSLSISIFLDNLADSRGGIGANIAYTMALLGNQPVLLGSVGREADEYMQDLDKLGINTKHVHKSQLPTASFNVFTDGGNRQIGGFYPGAMFDSAKLSFAPWKNKDAFMVIAPHDPKAMNHQVAQCKEFGLRLFYDVSQQVTNISGEDIRAGVSVAEVLIVNDYELSVICQKTGRTETEVKSLVPIVITTLGSQGSVVEGKNVPKPIHIGIGKPKKIVDPTGAGDAYRAGFLHGYVRGWDLKISARLGAICAAYAIEQPGTQNHVFNLNEAASRYQREFKELLPK
ncbi:MAG: carbohydrate kinase family protein [Candidatus Saccharimonadales bacterium]